MVITKQGKYAGESGNETKITWPKSDLMAKIIPTINAQSLSMSYFIDKLFAFYYCMKIDF